MSFFRLLRAEMPGSVSRLLLMSCLAGITNAAILAAVNSAAQPTAGGPPSLFLALVFVLLVFIFIRAQHFLLITATAQIETVIHKLRLRVMDRVRRSELLVLDTIGQSEIIGATTKDTVALTQAAHVLAYCAQGVILTLFVSVYIAYQSVLAFLLTIGVIVIVGLLFNA